MKNSLTISIIIIAFALALMWWLVIRPLPPLEGQFGLSSLRYPVIVRFDQRAVPYIEASCEKDLYIALGYVTARERMFQMDMLRRTALGSLSEVFGIGFLPFDRFVRTLGIKSLAEAELTRLSPPVRNLLDAYCQGINAYISYNNLPLEFGLFNYAPRLWNSADSLAIMKYLAYEIDESWRLDDLRQRVSNKIGDNLALQLFKDSWASLTNNETDNASSQKQERACSLKYMNSHTLSRLTAQLACLGHQAHDVRHPSPSWGSTACVISPLFSQSRGALLAADKHGNFMNPGDWYLCSLSCPGTHLVGATVAGVPAVMIGRNEFIAWSGASLKADVQDLFLEVFNSRLGKKYKTNKGWEDAREIEEYIPVRLSKGLVHKILVTRHGPILIRDDKTAVALAWQGSKTNKPTLEALWQLSHAYSWSTFVRALKKYSGASQLFVYADRWGNIGCQAAGDIPVRSEAGDGTKLVAGWENKGQWEASLPFRSLPTVFIPYTDTGQYGIRHKFLIAANQDLTKEGAISPGSNCYQGIGHQWSAPYRANRLILRLSTFDKSNHLLRLADLNQLQGDQYVSLATLVKKELRQAIIKNQAIDRYQLLALKTLDKWDDNLSMDSAAATIYESFLATLIRRLVEPKLGREMTEEYLKRWPLWTSFLEHYLQNKPESWLPPEERTYDIMLLTTFAQSLKGPRQAFYNSDCAKWLWRDVHKVKFKHIISEKIPWLAGIFDIGPLGVGGEGDCLNSSDVWPQASHTYFASESGSVERLLVDMSDQNKFYQSVVLGQSGHLLSPFRCDELKSWQNVNPLPVAFSRAQVLKQAQRKLLLTSTR